MAGGMQRVFRGGNGNANSAGYPAACVWWRWRILRLPSVGPGRRSRYCAARFSFALSFWPWPHQHLKPKRISGPSSAQENCEPGRRRNKGVLFMSTLTSLFEEKASRIAEQVSDLSRETADTVDHAIDETAGGLHATASSIRRGGRQGSKAIEDLAKSTANTLDEAGSYLKKHNLTRTIGDSRQLVRRYLARRYPADSLILAAGAGFLAGFAIRRLTHACDKSPARVSGD
jgi:hypothetical protein